MRDLHNSQNSTSSLFFPSVLLLMGNHEWLVMSRDEAYVQSFFSFFSLPQYKTFIPRTPPNLFFQLLHIN